MPDNTLQFSTSVNLGGLNSGLDAAKSAIADFGAQTATAMSDSKQATQALAEAQAQLGAAAAAGNAKAAAIIKQYQDQLDATVRKTQALTLEQKRQYEEATAAGKAAAQEDAAASKQAAQEKMAAEQQLTIAQKRQYEEYIAQQRAIQAADKSTISTRQALTAEMRIGEGSTQGATRAIAAYLSRIPALAAVAQAAFSAFALVAIGEVAFDMGKKLYDAFDIGGNRARKAAEDIAAVDLEVQRTVADLDVRLQKLIAEKEKLEGHAPTNGLALELAEATAEAMKLDAELERVNKQRAAALMEGSASMPQRVLGESGSHNEDVMLQEHTRHMNEAKTSQAQLSEQASYAAVLQQQLVELQGKQTQQEQILQASEATGHAARINDYTKEIASVQQLIKWRNDDQHMIEESNKVVSAQHDVNTLQGAKTGAADASKEARKDLQNIQAAFADLHTKLPEEAAAFWQSYLGNFKEGSAASGTEYTHVVEQINKFNDEFTKGLKQTSKLTEEMKKVAKENSTTGIDQADAVAKAIKLGNQMASQTAPDLAGQQHSANLGAIQQSEAKVTAGQSLGITDPTKDLEALMDLHKKAVAEDERYIQQEIQIYADEPKKVEELQKQLLELQQKGNLQQLQDTTKILQQQEQKYKTTYQAITQDFNQAISKMITTGESPAKAFAQMLDQMLGQLATFIATFLEKKAEMWVLDEILSRTSQTAAATATITSNAAVAASGAMAATASIPIVGPALAPAAAATTFAQTISFLGLAAFEQGGVVAGGAGMPVPIMAHAGERVLSAPQTQRFESLVNQSSKSSSVNLHYNPQISGMDKGGMETMLRSHASVIHDIVQQGARSGAIKARG